MKKLLALAVLALAFSLLGLSLIVYADDEPEFKKFDTLHEAATYAAFRLEECSHYYECSGIILKDPDGKYIPGPVRTDYDSNTVEVHRPHFYLDGFSLAADIHSHPCIPNGRTDVFSENDIISSLSTRTVGYMVDLCTGEVHEFIPGQSRVDEIEIENGLFLTGGKIIGHVPAYPNDAKANEGF